MEDSQKKPFSKQHWPLLVGAALTILILSGFGGYHYYLLYEEFESTKAQFAAVKEEMESRIEILELDKKALVEGLVNEQRKNQQLKEQIESIRETVGTLEKWRQLDPELLQKYSRVYFLSEHYTPSELTDIPEKYLLKEDEPEYIHTKVWPYLRELLDDAKQNGMPMKIVSAYRTFGEQEELNTSYSVIYGAGTANQFSAAQGYSEHQLGTTVDFTTEELGTSFESIENTEAYRWLQNNAHNYGFVLSYSEGNSYYQFEPWHWRFVGVALATELFEEEKNFYDLEQREIDEYLVNIFD